MGAITNKPQRGVERLVEHVQAIDSLPGRRTPLERLSDHVGVQLATMLVAALAGDHGMRRRDFAA